LMPEPSRPSEPFHLAIGSHPLALGFEAEAATCGQTLAIGAEAHARDKVVDKVCVPLESEDLPAPCYVLHYRARPLGIATETWRRSDVDTAPEPADAPLVHFHGPLTAYVTPLRGRSWGPPQQPLKLRRGEKPTEVYVVVATLKDKGDAGVRSEAGGKRIFPEA